MGKFTLYSFTEYAKLNGVSRRTVYNWLRDKNKKLKTVEISGKSFIKAPTLSLEETEA